jgi:hypothetical protein
VVHASIAKNRVELRHITRDQSSGRSTQSFERAPSPPHMSESERLDELRGVDAA